MGPLEHFFFIGSQAHSFRRKSNSLPFDRPVLCLHCVPRVLFLFVIPVIAFLAQPQADFLGAL